MPENRHRFQTRKLTVRVLIVAAVAVTAGCGGAHYEPAGVGTMPPDYDGRGIGKRQVPEPQALDVAVTANQGLLVKETFYKDENLRDVLEMRGVIEHGEPSPCVIMRALHWRGDPKQDIVDARTGQLLRSVPQRPLAPSFLAIGGMDRAGGIPVVQWSGVPVPTRAKEFCRDLDGDGELEFYFIRGEVDWFCHDSAPVEVWYELLGWFPFELCRYDLHGRKVWSVEVESYWAEADVCEAGDGEEGSVLIRREGEQSAVDFWSPQGKLEHTLSLPTGQKLVCSLSWPTRGYVLLFDVGGFFIVGRSGRVFLEHPTPFEPCRVQGVPVRFDPESGPYLAVLTTFLFWRDRAMLSIFSPMGELAYEEVLDLTTAIAAVPTGSGTEILLVGGGEGRGVFSYRRLHPAKSGA